MKRYFIIAYIIIVSALLTWSMDYPLNSVLLFVSSLVSVSMISLMFYWLYSYSNKIVSVMLSFVGFIGAFLIGLFLYRDTPIGLLSDITFKKFIFWSLYELVLIGFVYLIIQGLIKLVSRK